MLALRPCPSCARHARVSETACPFCGARLGEAFCTFAPPRAPAARLSRAALFAIGAAGFVGGAASCGSSASSAYGGCPPNECVITPEADAEASAGSAPDSANDVTNAPPPDAAPEAGSAGDASAGDADAGATADAAEEGPCNLICAAYGVNPDTGQDECWCQ
jgi:hypothetical protein